MPKRVDLMDKFWRWVINEVGERPGVLVLLRKKHSCLVMAIASPLPYGKDWMVKLDYRTILLHFGLFKQTNRSR